jgi:hypothetical protein
MKIRLVVLAFLLFLAGSTAFSASTYYIPHFAVGAIGNGSFHTTFVFFNNQSESSDVTLSLTGDNGAALSATISGMGTHSAFSFSLAGGATKILQATSSGNLQAGAATITSDLAIGVSGIYSEYDSNEKFVTEVGVENSNPLNNFIIPVQISDSTINTGLALFNPSTESSSITASLKNTDGTSAGNVDFTLSAGQHLAAYLNSSNLFPDITSFNGTLTIQSSEAVSAVTLRQNTPATTDYYTSFPVVSASSTKSTFYVPHVADGSTTGGAGYKTTFMIFNLSTSTADNAYVTLKFTNNDGAAFPVTFTGVTATTNSNIYTISLGAGQSAFMETDGSTNPITTGAAVITCVNSATYIGAGGPSVPIGVAAYYTQYDDEWNFQTEVGVLDSPALPSFTLPIDSKVPSDSTTPTFDTAIALFNPGKSTISITPAFLDANGVVTTSTTMITLMASGHYAGYFNELFPGLGAVQGSLVISSAPTMISAVTLRNNWGPVGWTSLPVTSGAYQTKGSAVVQDGAVSNVGKNTPTSVAVYHTTGTGPNPLMLVTVAYNANTSTGVASSVTFTPDGGGTPISLTSVISVKYSGSARFSEIWSLASPPSGQSGVVTVTFSAALGSGAVVGVVNFANVDQTTPLGAPMSASANTSATSTVTLTGLTGNELIMDSNFLGGTNANTQNLAPTSTQTPLFTNWATNTAGGVSLTQATSSSVTMGWTGAATAVWCIAAVPIIPAP